MVVMLFTPIVRYNATENFHTNRRPLSLSGLDEITFETQCSKKMQATIVVLGFVVGTASVMFI